MGKLTDRKVIMDLLENLHNSDGVSPLIKSYIRVAYNGLQQVKDEEFIEEYERKWRERNEETN